MEDTHTRELHIKSASGSKPTPRVKTPPAADAIPVPFVYSPSDDGTDENLLILLHGLGACPHFTIPLILISIILILILLYLSTGDTHVPFGKLGKQLKLPQTATLALRAPQQYVSPLLSFNFLQLIYLIPPCLISIISPGSPTYTKKPTNGIPPSTTSVNPSYTQTRLQESQS